MEETRLVNLPIIGMVQRGRTESTPKGTKRVIELDHFVAKVTDENMIEFLKKFNEIYENKSSIDIEIFDENPLTTKYARYNQGGIVCSGSTTSNIAYQKTKEGWKEVECSKNCIHRQRNKQGKCNCNRIGLLKFLMPLICTDRIWLMNITGQTSINRLHDYFELQRMQGKSIKGHYSLFLKQEKVSDFMGKTYNHYILDIVNKNNKVLLNNISSKKELNSNLSTEKEKNVDNTSQIIENSKNQQEENQKNSTTKTQEKSNTKTTNKNKKSSDEKEIVADKNMVENQNTKQEECSLDNCYVLIRTYNQDIEQKNGEKKSYVMGEFYNMEDKQFNVAIKPEDAEELLKCDTGTVTKMELQAIGNVHFALKLEYVQKLKKNIAA